MTFELRHPAGRRWLVVCFPMDGSEEWVIDGADDEAAAVVKVRKWSARGAAEWPGEFLFALAEATV